MLYLLAKRPLLQLSALALLLFTVSWSLVGPTASSQSTPDSYLYNTVDASPILEHGLAGANFKKATSPIVVEFYDPRCGACQAFKYNYIETAKKVQSTRPDVEFYGVSCAKFQSICSKYGNRVPKIMVFTSPESEGVDVPKGSGTIYFLTERLLKALRSPEEVAAHSATMESAVRRRLNSPQDDDEDAYGSEDVDTNGREGNDLEVPDAPDDDPKQSADDKEKKGEDTGTQVKWNLDKLVEIKGVPKDQWKPVHETDAWKNTMKELGDSDSKLGAEFLKWKHEHDAKLRAEAEKNEAEKDRLDSKITEDIKRGQEPKKSKRDGPSDADNKRAEFEKRIEGLKKRDAQTTQEEIRDRKRDEELKKAKQEQKEKSSQTDTMQIVINKEDVPPPNVFPANLDPDQEKRFKAFIEKKRQAAIRHEQLKHPVKTLLGGDATKTEQKQKDQSPMKNYKSQYVNPHAKNAQQHQKAKADLRPEAQKKSTSEKILSKVPIVKRAFNRHSKAHDTLNDAALSFTRGLLMGVFKGTNQGPLDYKRKNALQDWLDLLSVSLPPEMGLHELIDTLKVNIDSIATSEANMKAIIEKHQIPNANWSKSCTAVEGSLGFFCGFWKLLHIMSLGVAEQAGGLVLRESSPSIRMFSSKEAAAILREYMIYFFNCDKCVKRFVGQYDNCSFNRCHRLSDEIESASIESWRQFPLWLWEVHNDVSRSKADRAVEVFESRGRKADAQKFERDMRAVYPHLDQCVTCFDNEGRWNVDAVYNHLEEEYWDFGHGVNAKMDEMLDYRHGGRSTSSAITSLFLLSGALVFVTWLVKKRNLQLTGQHKKNEVEFRAFPPSRGRVKYRDS